MALFRGPVRDLIHALKYSNAYWAVDDLGRIAEYAEGLGDYLVEVILVPVPLHPRKERERGYNQSALIAESIAGRFEGVRLRFLLERIVDTRSQTQFNRQERYRNLRNAFSLAKKSAINPNQRYIIVDDVFTTGSTLNACAATLRKAGAKRVDVLTLGHG